MRISTNCVVRKLNDDVLPVSSADRRSTQPHRKIPADVIILANGFQTDQYALQMKIINGQGKSLEDYWKKDTIAPQAYRTEMCSPFPNMFIIWGA